MRFLFILAVFIFAALPAMAAPLRIIALGDSLTSGYGLEPGQDFAARLETALKEKGHDVKVENAGVAGDTSAGGLARIDWATGGEPKPALVILALGGNDLLRGINPDVTKKNLSAALASLKQKEIPVLLTGMQSATNMGAEYKQAFDALYPALAKEYGVEFYPFFLQGVALDEKLNQADGLHPNAQGVDVIVGNIVPMVEKMMAQE